MWLQFSEQGGDDTGPMGRRCGKDFSLSIRGSHWKPQSRTVPDLAWILKEATLDAWLRPDWAGQGGSRETVSVTV